MSHSMRTKHYTFIYNSDLSGSVEITNTAGTRFFVLGDQLLEFVAEYVRRERISKLESATPRSILGVE